MPINKSWEDLRVDATFHGAGAEPSELVRDLWARCAAIPGWFTIDDLGHFALALGLQGALGVRGDLVEIGAYHGRSAAVLAHFLRPGERLVLCDVFQTRPTRIPDPPTADDLRRHLAGAHPGLAPGDVVVHEGESATLELAPGRFRFAHVDGDHAEEASLGDLRRVAPSVAPGGLLVVDDFHHAAHPGVTAAVERFLGERDDFRAVADLNRHGERGRKLYLCRALAEK